MRERFVLLRPGESSVVMEQGSCPDAVAIRPRRVCLEAAAEFDVGRGPDAP